MDAGDVAGTGPGQRRLNGPQTTGREYRNLSQPRHAIRSEADVAVPVRDGVSLLADVHRPDADGRFPALIAASCYPRQLQNSGLPMGFVEAGATDFWVPRGYAHVIANVRGTGGSGGRYAFLDGTERDDLHDLVEWAAAQPWCDGRVGMIGISYFAMTQLAAAAARPASLRAIFPVAASADLYEIAWHGGLLSQTFMTAWMAGVGGLADKPSRTFASPLLSFAERVLRSDAVHRRLEHFNGEAALSTLGRFMRMRYDASWDDLWFSMIAEHPARDAFWDDRDMVPLLRGLSIPAYLGCDWDNVPLHLPSTFLLWRALSGGPAPVRLGMLGSGGLGWPWESLHFEALAWFDHWLKDADTGVLEGPPVRWWLPGADEFRVDADWPPPASRHVQLALRADGMLDAAADDALDERVYGYVPPSIPRPKGAPIPTLPPSLAWETAPLAGAVDVAGSLELLLDASTTAPDTAWIATLQDVAPDGRTTDVTAGWLRASLRAVDTDASRPGAPVVRCRERLPVPAGEIVRYRIPLVDNARRFAAGHRIRLTLASDDTARDLPAVMGFHHAPLADPARNAVRSTSRLLLPVLASADPGVAPD